jgi:hypothetical protein
MLRALIGLPLRFGRGSETLNCQIQRVLDDVDN